MKNPFKAPPEIKQLHKILDHGASKKIEATVEAAELKTTSEIMVRLAALSPKGEIRAIAENEFTRLGLADLELGNGVLLYVALDRRAVEVVVGPEAARVIDVATWQQAVEIVVAGFKSDQACQGIIDAVNFMTTPLAEHFPHTGPDRVNLPNVTEDQ